MSEKVSEGVTLGTMHACSRTDLVCILPLGVAVNSAGKLRLIWDGRHVNGHLPHHNFRMETLQREGRSLFERSGWGGTVDISAAYHHLEMHPDSTPFLGFEWRGAFYRFVVLPFGLSTAPWLFTTVMGHCANFLRSSTGPGIGLLRYLDDLIFAASTAREALRSAMVLLGTLRKFGWLIHPRKCQGVSETLQCFTALGTLVNLATQTYSIPPATVDRILLALSGLATGPPEVPVRHVARVKGLLSATWISIGIATRIRTRALSSVVDSRPGQGGKSKRECRRSWASLVPLTRAARDEIRWWQRHLCTLNGLPIRPRPFDMTVDSSIFSDASDTGVGAFLSTDGHTGPASSLVNALLAHAPPGTTVREVREHTRRGIEFAAPLPPSLRGASSTLCELFGVVNFILLIRNLLRGGAHRVVLDNLGCVFILGGVVPPFAVGGKVWGEYVSGGSPNPDLQHLALQAFDAQLACGFSLQAVWVPRDLNVRADFLSHAAEYPDHAVTTDTLCTKPCFRCLTRSGGLTLSTALQLQATDCCQGSAPGFFTLMPCGQTRCLSPGPGR